MPIVFVRMNAQPYDFRRPDRIAKEQLRSIQVLHENFARDLGSSLSAYLRAYVVANFLSVEQLSFAELLTRLPSPTCMITLRMSQLDNEALLELSPSIAFPLLEMLLGGASGSTVLPEREITEIEQSILDSVVRIVLRDLREAWRQVVSTDFEIQAYETEPQLVRIHAPNEAMVLISLEIRIGEVTGQISLAVPSITVKMLTQQFISRRVESAAADHARIFKLIRGSVVRLDSRLRGPTLTVENLLKLNNGDVLAFDYPVEKPIDVAVNGKIKFRGQMVATGRKRSVVLQDLGAPEST